MLIVIAKQGCVTSVSYYPKQLKKKLPQELSKTIRVSTTQVSKLAARSSIRYSYIS